MTYPTLVVEIGFSGPTTEAWLHLDDQERGLLDTGTLAPDDAWTDVTAFVHAGQIQSGASRVESPVIKYDASTCHVVLNNNDRRFDPTNLAGPYVVAGVTQVTPMRAIRIRATHEGTTYDLFRGFIDAWNISYEEPNRSICEVTATDAVKVLSNFERIAVSAVGAGEDSGARAIRVLDSISWPATDRMIATGNTTLQATTLEGDAWSELLEVAETEVGEAYVNGSGHVVFRNRHAASQELRSNSVQAIFGDESEVLS